MTLSRHQEREDRSAPSVTHWVPDRAVTGSAPARVDVGGETGLDLQPPGAPGNDHAPCGRSALPVYKGGGYYADAIEVASLRRNDRA